MRRKMSRLPIILTCAMLAGLLSACGSGPASNDGLETENKTETEESSTDNNAGTNDDAEARDSTLKIALLDDPQTLDPWTYNGAHLTINPYYYETLGFFENGEIKPLLAKEWAKEEGTEFPSYDITLWDNIYDSEGNHITADDVIWSWEKHQEANLWTFVRYVDSFEKISEYEVRLALNTNILTRFERVVGNMPVLSQAAYEASPDGMVNDPVGTGPYVVTDYQSGTSLVLKKNENYWQTDENVKLSVQKANFDTLEFHVIKELSQVAIALEAGEVDVSFLDGELSKRFEEGGSSSEGFEVMTIPTAESKQFFLNCSDNSVFKDNVALRQAVMHGINSEEIVMGAADGKAVALHDLGAGYNISDYPTKWDSEPYFEYDPELAAKYLEEAGYAPGELTVRLVYQTNNQIATMSQIIQGNLAAIGINVELLAYEGALYEQYRTDSTQWDMLIYNISGGVAYGQQLLLLEPANHPADVRSTCFADDDQLYSLVSACTSSLTAGDDTYQAWHEYNDEMAYVRGLVAFDNVLVYNSNKINEMVLSNFSSQPSFGAIVPAE